MKYLLITALMMTGQAALAQDCADAADQMTMNICADKAYKTSDAALNTAYKALMGSIEADGRKSLQAAQRDWIAFRDAQCAFETMGTAGGSIHPMVMSICLQELTEAQTARLNAQLTCEEGDTSCGGQ